MSRLQRLQASVTSGERRLEKRITRSLAVSLLVLIIAASCALAGVWVFLVPIYQGPDEILNDDYSFSLLRAGHLLDVREHPPGIGHPYTTYLADATGGERIPFHDEVKAPPGYGGRAYFDSVNAGAPALDRPPAYVPYLATRYPFGYFALTAAWLALVSAVAGGGPVTLFFGARLLSVLMLAGTLALGYGVTRELGIGRLRALLVTAAIGFFPLTSFVASYAQADNLAWLLTSAALLVALRCRSSGSRRHLALLGLLLGLLLVTKYQFFLCTTVAVVAALLAWRRTEGLRGTTWPAGAALLAVPSAALGSVQYWVGYGSPFPLVGSSRSNSAFWTDENLLVAARGGPGSLARYVAGDVARAVQDYFGGGPTFTSFWGVFGWSDTELLIRTRAISAGIRSLILVVTLILAGLVVVRAVLVARRVWTLRRAGRGRRAFRALAGNPAVNAYVLFVAFMVAFFVYTDDSFYGQGRNWLPYILPAFLLGIFIAPRAASRKWAPSLSAALLIALLVYSSVGARYALSSVRERYYGNGRQVAAVPADGPRLAGAADIQYGIDFLLPAGLLVRSGEPLAIVGWAGSSGNRGGVLAVFVTIDGSRPVEAVYGDSRDDVVAMTRNPNFARSGFDLLVPTGGLAPGPHVLSLRIVTARDGSYHEIPERVQFAVREG